MNAPLQLAPSDERAEAEALEREQLRQLPYDADADSKAEEDDLREEDDGAVTAESIGERR